MELFDQFEEMIIQTLIKLQEVDYGISERDQVAGLTDSGAGSRVSAVSGKVDSDWRINRANGQGNDLRSGDGVLRYGAGRTGETGVCGVRKESISVVLHEAVVEQDC